MNKDAELLAEAYQRVQENIVTDKIKHMFNSVLDKIEEKLPETYDKIVSAASPEELKKVLVTPAVVSALGAFGFLSSVAAAHAAGSEATSGEASVIMTTLISSALMALYGVVKARHGWTKPIGSPRSGSEIMSDVEAKRAARGPSPKL
jgi:hypothetical protein